MSVRELTRYLAQSLRACGVPYTCQLHDPAGDNLIWVVFDNFEDLHQFCSAVSKFRPEGEISIDEGEEFSVGALPLAETLLGRVVGVAKSPWRFRTSPRNSLVGFASSDDPMGLLRLVFEVGFAVTDLPIVAECFAWRARELAFAKSRGTIRKTEQLETKLVERDSDKSGGNLSRVRESLHVAIANKSPKSPQSDS